MNETCVMCGAELPTENGKQYCAECEKEIAGMKNKHKCDGWRKENDMEFNGKEFAKKMRDGKSVDLYGNVVCSLEVWERIASMLEGQADEIDRLLNLLCKIDRMQEEHIQENYVPYEQYEELLEENKKLKAQR